MFGWFKIKSPLKEEQRKWIDQRFQWLRAEFGEERLQGKVVTPTDEFFPDRYSGTRENASAILDRVCKYMGVDRARLNLKFYQSRSADEVASAFNPLLRQQYALGAYDEQDGRIDIWLETTQLSNPVSVVSTLAHELGHVHLLGDRRVDAETEDHEPLTDLLTVYFGMGVFAANSVLRESNWRAGNISGWSMSSSGYLSQAEIAYALAPYAHARGELKPRWTSYLRKDPYALFKVELKELTSGARVPCEDASGPFEYPKQSTDAGDEEVDADDREADNAEQDMADEIDSDVEDASESGSLQGRAAADELFSMGVGYEARGQYELAIEAYTKALQNSPSDEEVWSHRGRANLAVGNYAAAIDDCTKSLRIASGDVDTALCRATAYLWLRKYEKALPDLEHAICEDRKDPRAWHFKGIANLGLRKFKQALKDLDQAVRFAPTWADNYLARSRARDALGDARLAQADLHEAIRRNPELADESTRRSHLAARA